MREPHRYVMGRASEADVKDRHLLPPPAFASSRKTHSLHPTPAQPSSSKGGARGAPCSIRSNKVVDHAMDGSSMREVNVENAKRGQMNADITKPHHHHIIPYSKRTLPPLKATTKHIALFRFHEINDTEPSPLLPAKAIHQFAVQQALLSTGHRHVSLPSHRLAWTQTELSHM